MDNFSDDFTYRNPFTLLGLQPGQTITSSTLQLERKRLLAEAKLNEDGTYTKGKITLNAYEIEQLFTELTQSQNLGFYVAVAQCRDLDAFLSGSKTYQLINILDDSIWNEPQHIKEKALAYFANHYSRRLKNAVISNKTDELKNLTNADLEEWGFVDSGEYYGETKHYLDGVLSDLQQSARQQAWLDYNEASIWEFVYANFSPDTLNLLPDEFNVYRDDIAVALVHAARNSYTYQPNFFKVAQKIAFKFKLSERGLKRLQTEIEEIARTEQFAANHRTESQRQMQDDSSGGTSGWYVFKILFFTVFMIFKISSLCNSTSKKSDYNSNKYEYNNGIGQRELEQLVKKSNQQKIESIKVLTSILAFNLLTDTDIERFLVMNKKNTCYTASSTATQKAFVMGQNAKVYVVYVQSKKNGKYQNSCLATIRGNGQSCILIPKNQDFQLLFAVADTWVEGATNPCKKNGFVNGNTNYYKITKPFPTNHPSYKHKLKLYNLEENVGDVLNIGKDEFFRAVAK
jgi:hypothetical protein